MYKQSRFFLTVVCSLTAIIAIVCQAFAQTEEINSGLADTEIQASEESPPINGITPADSLYSEAIVTAELDSLSYSADSLFYDVASQRIRLITNSKLEYHSSSIKADEIIIDLDKDQAYTVGQTWMQDGTQILAGSSIQFDLASQTGVINDGASRLDKGFYYGKEIRRVDEDVYDIDQGYFTTCEIKEPNFYIYSGKMRLYYRDKIVAKPIVFYVNHFPILALPYATFSIKTDRASGLLVPDPGYNSVDGKYIENIALYHFYGDYAEALAVIDWREKTGWEARFESNYVRRYFFNGSLLARFQENIISPGNTRREWYLRARHRHDFIDRSSFDANLEFMSSRTIWESSEQIDERLNERITSSLNYRKPFTSTTLNTGATYTDNLTDETKQIVLPTVSYSLPSKPVHEFFLREQASPAADAWWQRFYYSYSLRGVHYGSITDPNASLADILFQNSKDTDGNYINQHNAGIRHSLGLSYNNNIGGWLNFSQSVNGNEIWFDRDKEGKQFVRGHDYSTNTRVSTSLYGIRSFPNFPISAVRHVMTPSTSYSYSPDFSHNERFFSFSGISLNRGTKQRNLNFALDHKWSIKYHDRRTDKEESLNDLVTLSSSVSYDLEKDENQFSDINHSASFRPGKVSFGKLTLSYNVNGSARQDSYDFNIRNWRVSNVIGFSGEAQYYNYFPQEKNIFFTGESFQSEQQSIELPEDFDEELPEDFSFEDFERTMRDVDSVRQNFPWNVNFTHDYSKVRTTGYKTSNLRSSLSFRLTQNWSVNYNNYVNLEDNKLISQSISIDRNLNCWKLLFTWSKQGNHWNYRLQLYNIKLPESLRIRSSQHKRG